MYCVGSVVSVEVQLCDDYFHQSKAVPYQHIQIYRHASWLLCTELLFVNLENIILFHQALKSTSNVTVNTSHISELQNFCRGQRKGQSQLQCCIYMHSQKVDIDYSEWYSLWIGAPYLHCQTFTLGSQFYSSRGLFTSLLWSFLLQISKFRLPRPGSVFHPWICTTKSRKKKKCSIILHFLFTIARQKM